MNFFLYSFSISSLLVYRKATDFCKLILYPATLLKLLMVSGCFWWSFLGLWGMGPCCLKIGTVWVFLYLFVFVLSLLLTLLFWLGIGGLCWIGVGIVGILVSFLTSGEILSPLSMMLATGLSYIAFIMLRYLPSIPSFLELLFWSGVVSYQRHFLHPWDDQVHLSFLVLMCCVTFIDLGMLNHPCIPGMKLTWSWWMSFLICCDMLLDFVCLYFIEDFCTDVH
jgi:hypothetical protein